MSVWYAIPSKRPPAEAQPVIDKWIERGYNVALFRDANDAPIERVQFMLWGTYPGYAAAVNKLARTILDVDPRAEWIIHGGDDIEPDPNHTAKELAEQCRSYFRTMRVDGSLRGREPNYNGYDLDRLQTFGVMQPTGDRWGDDAWSRQKWPGRSAYIDRVAGSPWCGREFCRRMYGGRGPLFEGYFHMFEDEELQNVATRLGVFWQRPDLTHHHNHWARARGAQEDCPEFLKPVSIGPAGEKHWKESQALFNERMAAGFPGHEPIE